MSSTPSAVVDLGTAKFGNALPLAVIAGPCQLESRAHALEMASALKEIAAKVGIGLVYKTSFDKANRTSASAARGIGLEAALPIFAEIRDSLGLPVLTDVHDAGQCARAAEAVDILQIPAFLCRQTDLLIAAAETGKVVNVKKGQFLAPWDMKNVVAKITGAGNARVLVTERTNDGEDAPTPGRILQQRAARDRLPRDLRHSSHRGAGTGTRGPGRGRDRAGVGGRP